MVTNLTTKKQLEQRFIPQLFFAITLKLYKKNETVIGCLLYVKTKRKKKKPLNSSGLNKTIVKNN